LVPLIPKAGIWEDDPISLMIESIEAPCLVLTLKAPNTSSFRSGGNVGGMSWNCDMRETSSSLS